MLINGDCLKELKNIESESVDMVLSDPPYGMDFRSNRRKEKYDHIENDKDLSWVDDFVDEIYRIMKNNTNAYLFCSFHKIDVFKRAVERKFTLKNILIWEKNNHSTGDLKGDYAPKVEFIIFAVKGKRELNGKRVPNIFKFDKTGNIHHPTEKPVDMMKFFIEKSSNEGEIIMDPFMGSGSTGVAAKELGRDFIGIELEEKYFNIASERIEKAIPKISNLFQF